MLGHVFLTIQFLNISNITLYKLLDNAIIYKCASTERRHIDKFSMIWLKLLQNQGRRIIINYTDV